MREDLSAKLLDVIQQVRRRWRMKLALRGAVGVAALGLLVFLVSARALEAARFTPQAIITFRIVLAAVIAGLVAYLLVRPLLRRVRDDQVAMYLEEHEPTLQASIISAIEAARDSSTPHSQALVRKLVEDLPDKDPRHQWPQIETDDAQRAEEIKPRSKGDQARDVPPRRSDRGWLRWCMHTGFLIF